MDLKTVVKSKACVFICFYCIDSRATPKQRWRALAFVPLLPSLSFTNIVIIYTQLLQEEKVFSMIPRSGWSTQWSLKYAWNAQKFEWKTQSKISFDYTWLLHGKNCPSLWCFFRIFWTGSKPKVSHWNQKIQKEEKGKEKNYLKKRKSLKTWVTFLSKILIYVHAWAKMS